MFKVGDLVRISPEWLRQCEKKIPVGIVTAMRDRGNVNVFWFAERTVYEDEDPRALMLLNES